MRYKRRLREKLLAVFLMAAVTVTMIPAGFALSTEEAGAATTYSYSVTRPTIKVNGHTTHATKFTVSALGLTGACAQMGNRAKNGKATVKRMSASDQRVKIMYYYGFEKGYLGQTNKNAILLSRAISWLSGHSKVSPLSLSEVKSFINAMPSSVVVPNRFECYQCNPTNGSQDFIAAKLNPPAYVSLKKTSTDGFSLAAGSGYSFAGIEYTVYNSGGGAAGVLTCGANGATNTLTLDTGTYTVRETKTNQWYKLNPKVYTGSLGAGQTWTIAAADSPETGTIQIRKKVTGHYDGDLAFDFKLTNTANPSIVYKVRTDASTGEASAQVIQGTYRCEEVLPEDADLVDLTGPQTATVGIGETVSFERENKAVYSGMLMIRKATNDGGSPAGFRFKVSGVLYNQGRMGADKLLAEAEPSVTDYDEDVYELGEWKVSEDDLTKLNKAAADRETDRKTVRLSNTLKYKGEKGISISDIVEGLNGEETEGTIAGGTYISLDGKVYRAKDRVAFAVAFAETQETEEESAAAIDKEKTAENIRELLMGESFEEVDTSDIEVSAVAAVDLKPVEYVYDNEHPEASAYETDTDKQIKNKRQTTEDKGKYKVTCTGFDWHGSATVYQEIIGGALTGNTEVMLETGEGGSTPELSEGITHGKFTVEEVMTDDQKRRYRQPQKQTKEITKQDGHAVFIFGFENEARWTGVELMKTSPDGKIDGISFRLEGIDSRGERIELEAVTDSEGRIDFGKLYAGEYVISEKDFDPDAYENNYRIDGYDSPAQRLVVTGDETERIRVDFENVPLKSLYVTKVDKETQLFLKNAVFSLLEGDEQLALFRLVLDDYGRAGIDMISCDENSGIRTSIPQVSLFPENEGSEDGDEAEETKAEYNFAVIKGLKEGKTYTMKEITAPQGYAGAANCTFVFEDGQKLIIENAAPVISTTARDKATKMQMSNAHGMVTIVDTVSYSNLAPGHKYVMSGILADKPVGERTQEEQEQEADIVEIIKDANGKEVTAQKEFVPESESGTVDIEFTFDASLLDGKQVVAMEQLVDPALTGVNGLITIVASHEDIEDEAQTIYFPEIGTKASADDTGKRITEADGEVVINDTVAYSNVVAGKVYEMTGTLMDRDTGKPMIAGGAEVTSSVTFRAEKDGPVFAAEGEKLEETQQEKTELVSGNVEMQFRFDGAALAGKQVVVFEKLTTGGSLVGEHSDLNDEAQTVNLPTINTTASTNGIDQVSDKVEYTNLLPGEQYIMRGVLMDKTTGEELLLNGNPVTAETTFVPEKKDGAIRMDFPVSVKDLEGKTAVVFETCSMITGLAEAPVEIEVINHRDINNKAQTVTFEVPQTGQAGPLGVLAPMGLFVAAAVFALARRFRKAAGLW